MADKSWKVHERRTAALLGGKRTGNRGTNTNDIEHDWLAVECKHKKTLPAWLHGAMQQAEANRDGDHKLPIVVLHELNQRAANDFVVIRMRDFVEFFGDAGPQEEEKAPWAGKVCECGNPAEWPDSKKDSYLCQECWERPQEWPKVEIREVNICGEAA